MWLSPTLRNEPGDFLWNVGFSAGLRGNGQLELREPLLLPYWLPLSTHNNLNH